MKIIKLMCCSTILMASFGAMAAPFTYTWSSTTDGGSSGDFTGAAGRPVVISITLDNGGSTNVNQTWTSSELVSVSYSLSGSALSTIAVTVAGHSLNVAPGDFQSNGAGDLTAMSTSYNGELTNQTPVTPGTDTDPVFKWWINTGNPIYSSDGNTNTIKVNNHTQMNTASNWQRSGSATPPAASNTVTAVPSMPMVAFGILGLMLSFFGGRFKTKH